VDKRASSVGGITVGLLLMLLAANFYPFQAALAVAAVQLGGDPDLGRRDDV